MKSRQDRFCDEVDASEDSLVALLRDLIRFPTVNPPGEGYFDICSYLAEYLYGRGFETELIRATDARGDSERYPRWNLVARREGDRAGPCVHFNGHTDVVEVGRDWTMPPFEGVVRDRRVYGRGACDMKGGIAAAIVAIEAFLATWPDHRGAIEISATADAETGGYGGVAHLARKGFFDPARVQHVIIPEPLNKDRICLGHRGVWWAEITTIGRIAHGAMPFLGDCAVRHMGEVIAEMEASLLPALAKRQTKMQIVPPAARSSSINFCSIHGGQDELPASYTGFPSPVVPDRCRIVIDRRFLIEEPVQDVKQEVIDLLDRIAADRPGFRYEIRDLHEVLPSMTDRNAPVVGAVERGVQQILGTQPEFVVSPGTYDQKHIDRIGRLKNCIAYGPGVLEVAHQPDEWVGIDDMLTTAKIMGLALADLLA